MRIMGYLVSALLLWMGCCPGLLWALQPARKPVDNSLYAALLRKYDTNGRIDYRGLKADEKQLDAYLKVLATTDTGKLDREEQFAFYINAYNAWTLKLVLSGYPGITSIWDLGGRFFNKPFDKKFIRLDGKQISLDDIENRILRPRFKDPRVHFAINCASKSCPALSAVPYDGKRLNAQLDAATRRFINDPTRNYLKGDTLYASKLFKWYRADFKTGIIGFFIRFADTPLKEKLIRERGRLHVRYLPYDWTLNGS